MWSGPGYGWGELIDDPSLASLVGAGERGKARQTTGGGAETSKPEFVGFQLAIVMR